MKLLKIVVVNVFLSSIPFTAVWGNTENKNVPSTNVHNIVIDKRQNDVTNDTQRSNSQNNQIKIDKTSVVDSDVKNTTQK